MGRPFPESFASALCMQHDSVSRAEKTPVPAGVQGNLGISSVALLLRRFFGQRGGAARPDSLAAVDVDAISNEGDDFGACVAYRKAKKKGGKKKAEDGGQKKVEDRASEDGQTF